MLVINRNAFRSPARSAFPRLRCNHWQARETSFGSCARVEDFCGVHQSVLSVLLSQNEYSRLGHKSFPLADNQRARVVDFQIGYCKSESRAPISESEFAPGLRHSFPTPSEQSKRQAPHQCISAPIPIDADGNSGVSAHPAALLVRAIPPSL